MIIGEWIQKGSVIGSKFSWMMSYKQANLFLCCNGLKTWLPLEMCRGLLSLGTTFLFSQPYKGQWVAYVLGL